MTRFLLPAAFAASFAMPALACDGLEIVDPYARSSSMMAQSGAAFMGLVNMGETDCRMIAARSDVAQRVELHTHIEDDQGVMRMVEVEGGFTVPAGGEYSLARGGDHIMFLGLTRPLEQGDEFSVTLVFDGADEIEIIVPVDLERMPTHGHSHSHSHEHSHDHDHGHSHD